MLTAKELIDLLKTVEPNAEVVAMDWFGQPVELHISDFSIGEFWSTKKPFVEIPVVDIGPEPE